MVHRPGRATKAIGRITKYGTISELGTASGLNAGSNLQEIVPGADGNLWFTDRGTTKAFERVTVDDPGRGHQLTCTETVTYTLFPAHVSATSAPVVVQAGD